MNILNILQTRSRRFHFRRRHVAPALSVAVGLVLLGLGVRSALIRQMRLPRLALDQGGTVTSVAIMPDGRTVLSGDDPTHEPLLEAGNAPADVFVWDAASGRQVRRLHGLFWRAEGVTVSPDGKRVFATGFTSRDPVNGVTSHVTDWDAGTGRALWTQPGGLPLSLSPDGHRVGSVPDGKTSASAPVLRNAATGTPVCRITARIAEDGQIGFTPDGALFGGIVAGQLDPATGFSGKDYYTTTRLHFWRADTGRQVKDFPFTRVRAWDVSRDGRWLVLVSDARIPDLITNDSDGAIVRRVDFQTGAVAWTRECHMNGPDVDPDAFLNSVAISPNGKSVVVEGINCHLVVLDAATGRERFRPFVPHSREASGWALPGGLAFSADGRTLVSRCGPQVLVWDASSLR